MTCRALNDACSPYIFYAFILALRVKVGTFTPIRWRPCRAGGEGETRGAAQEERVRALVDDRGWPT